MAISITQSFRYSELQNYTQTDTALVYTRTFTIYKSTDLINMDRSRPVVRV